MTAAFAPYPKVKLRVEDYGLLAESGALGGLERSELLDGDIYLMSPQYRPHAFAKTLIFEALLDYARAQCPRLWVISEASVEMPPNDEPMPDLILTSQPLGERGIPVDSVSLLVEVSDDTLKHDLGYKASLYATQKVPEYWVIDISGRVIFRHTLPGTDGYDCIDRIAFGQTVTSLAIKGLAVETVVLRDS